MCFFYPAEDTERKRERKGLIHRSKEEGGDKEDVEEEEDKLKIKMDGRFSSQTICYYYY